MTYHQSTNGNDNTVLVARRGYGGLSGLFDALQPGGNQAMAYCGQKFGAGSSDYQPCVNFYLAGQPGEYKPSASTLQSIGGGVKDILLGGISAYAAAKGASNMPMMMPPPPNPLMMPLILGGVGIVMIMLLRRPRRSGGGGGAAPTSNPRRRRRRRRNGRRTYRRHRRHRR